ncbi:MAG: dephospho-CoA kinase [Acidobacteriota bacterium]
MGERFVIGLTGGLAAGKSTVARLLAERGVQVVDADRVVAESYRPMGEGAAIVRRLFGDGALDDEGGVDRQALAAHIFEDRTARARLEAEIHPFVRRRFRQIAAQGDGLIVFEATLLAESGGLDDFDLILSVEANEAVRLERAIARGLSEDDARARLAAQGDGAQRRAAADRILTNDGDLSDLEAAVDRLLDDIHAEMRASASQEIAAGDPDDGAAAAGRTEPADFDDTSDRRLLRHGLATLAFRLERAIEDAPDDFATFAAGDGVRTPAEIVRHLSALLGLLHGLLEEERIWIEPMPTWAQEVERFGELLQRVDGALAHWTPADPKTAERILQGPLADAFSHVGQLTMLRRLSGSPIDAANYWKADIRGGS